MIQSLVQKESVDELAAVYGHVVVDECYHVPAVSFRRVLSEVRARHVVCCFAATSQEGSVDYVRDHAA